MARVSGAHLPFMPLNVDPLSPPFSTRLHHCAVFFYFSALLVCVLLALVLPQILPLFAQFHFSWSLQRRILSSVLFLGLTYFSREALVSQPPSRSFSCWGSCIFFSLGLPFWWTTAHRRALMTAQGPQCGRKGHGGMCRREGQSRDR